MRKLLILGVVVGLSGCASLSQEECLTGDWHGIGYSDGVQGKVESVLAEHQEACSEYQIKLDLQDYLNGRQQGLKTYCKPDNGYRLGLNGSTYHYVCPETDQSAFLSMYSKGKAQYDQQQKVKKLERELRQLQRQQDSLEEQIKETENKLVADGLSSIERQRLLKQLRDLELQRPDKDYEYRQTSSLLHLEREALYRLQRE